MDADVRKRMKEVEELVLDLDSSVRGAGFAMFEQYVLTGSLTASFRALEKSGAEDPSTPDELDLEAFFSSREAKRPSDAAILIAAYHYQRYGTESFSLAEVKEIAGQVGLTIPDRLDMTFKGTLRKGKPVFRQTGRGRYSPTVIGEAVLKEEYGVKKGRTKKPAEAS